MSIYKVVQLQHQGIANPNHSMANGGGGGGKGGGSSSPPPPAPAAPPPAATPMKNPNNSASGSNQSDIVASREGTRSLRIDLGTGTNSSSTSSGLSIPS